MLVWRAMAANTVPILIYCVVAWAMAWLCGRDLSKSWRIYLGWFLILGTLAIPLAFDSSRVSFIASGFLALMVILERVFPRNKYSFVSDDNLRNATYILLKRILGFVFNATVVLALAKWHPVPWGLAARGVSFWIQIAVALLVLDFYQYLYHFGQHRFDVWWKFHQLHHATEELTALAAGRTHLLDVTVRQTFLVVLTHLLGLDPAVFTYGYLMPGLFFDTLNHTNMDIPFGRFSWITYIFNLPQTHAVHHTRIHDRTNFGFIFSFWDVVFGTFQTPSSGLREFGVGDNSLNRLGILKQHLTPFKASGSVGST